MLNPLQDCYDIQSKPTEEEDLSSVEDDNENVSGLIVSSPEGNVLLVDQQEQQTNNNNGIAQNGNSPNQDASSLRPTTTTTTTSTTCSSSRSSSSSNLVRTVQYVASALLLLFSMVIVVATIFAKQSNVAAAIHPVVALALLLALLLWLAVLEGGQGCLVGLAPVPPAHYQDSHPWAHHCTAMVYGATNNNSSSNNNNKKNLERFIVGRQFLVVLVVFGINQCASFVADNDDDDNDDTTTLLGLPNVLQQVFVTSGVALMLVTIVVGQLTAQVNAAHCMLDFINHVGMLVTVWMSLLMEACGVLHAVYLVQYALQCWTNKNNHHDDENNNNNSSSSRNDNANSQEPEDIDNPDDNEAASSSSSTTTTITTTTSVGTRIFFWLRVLFSLAVLALAFAVTMAALFAERTAMWQGVPKAASVVIFIVLTCFVGLLEGLQIALFAVAKLPTADMQQHASPMALANCALIFQQPQPQHDNAKNNFQAFLIGRQVCVTICMFLVARITTITDGGNDNDDNNDNDNDTLLGVPAPIQEFFQTGLLGAVITTIVGSLVWRVVASAFPLAFLANPFVYVVIRLCLYLEASGVCTSAWMLAAWHKRLVGLQPDAHYLQAAAAAAAAAEQQPQQEQLKESMASTDDVEAATTSSREVEC